MSDFTLKSVIESIGAALSGEFPNAAVYAESVEQGLSLPCFFIQCTNGSTKPYPFGRYYRKYHFVIQYLPSDGLNPKEECAEAADKLYKCLELIGGDGDLIRGTNLYQEYSANILNFSVDYGCFVRSDTDTATDNGMEGLEGLVSTKGG